MLGYLDRVDVNDALNDSFLTTQGQISYFGDRSLKNEISPRFTYTVGGVLYETDFKSKKLCNIAIEDRKRVLKGLDFPVVYSPTEPEKAKILISKSDYEELGVELSSDSLTEIQTLLYNCE